MLMFLEVCLKYPSPRIFVKNSLSHVCKINSSLLLSSLMTHLPDKSLLSCWVRVSKPCFLTSVHSCLISSLGAFYSGSFHMWLTAQKIHIFQSFITSFYIELLRMCNFKVEFEVRHCSLSLVFNFPGCEIVFVEEGWLCFLLCSILQNYL